MRNAKSIPEICRLLSENLSHNLRLAKTDEERRQFITATLTAFGQKVIPPLNQLKEIHSDGNPELDSARLAALELASVICGGLVRSAADYRTAINSLDALTDICREPQLKVKLVFYTNQLKKRWLIIEPGGLAHNPRAKRMTTERTGKSQMTNILVSLVFLGALFFVLLGLDLTKLIFPVQNSSQPAQQLPHNSEVRQVAPPLSPLQQIQPASSTRNESTLYTFTDKQGVVHMVDMLEKVPQAYRRNMKVDTSGPSVAAAPRSSSTVIR